VGHIRDLPSKGLAVDPASDFKVVYEINPGKKDVIKSLRSALASADELYLATDEDREGEAIAAHLADVLKPSVPVKRMVFHEITKGAIQAAIDNPREIDFRMVDAQEARRIVDRLFGYPVSGVLWRKVNQGLSAGRVQSPAVRLIVERERERIAFVPAGYWDLTAGFPTDPAFEATLVEVDGQRVASGRDFGQDGTMAKPGVVVVDEARANELRTGLDGSTFTVASTEEKPWRSRPKAPFMTSTLQQEGGRKLRLSAQQVMRLAQSLYEKGYITYMRTDSTTLSATALSAARTQVQELYGAEYLPDAPRTYDRKVKNAQEAHEAIRPAGEAFRTPDDVAKEVPRGEADLYELIWKRTIASQMNDAVGRTLTVRIGAPAGASQTVFSVSGRTITFPGYMKAYVDTEESADGDEQERSLPPLAEGDVLPNPDLSADGHTTTPPARYNEASLIKRMEELGIGRPSTYASIMETIQNRGYVYKKGTALVPTWTAFAVTRMLEDQFLSYVDYDFTARMEDDLDRIAVGQQERVPWLRLFWFGEQGSHPGLESLVDRALEEVDAAELNTFPLGLDAEGEPVVVKPGRYGPYVKRGEDTASVPQDLPPDELTLDKAMELLAAPKGDEPLGFHPDSGLPVYAKNGRFGPYVQLGDVDTLPPGEKPKMESLFKDMSLERLSLDDALTLLSLPRTVGVHPETGVEIVARNGRYGPYVSMDKESRSLDSEQKLFEVTLDEAVRILAEPRKFGRGTAKPPLKEVGTDPISGKPVVVKDGRFGLYVTDGETNATLQKADTVEDLSIERAAELLQARRDRIAADGGVKKRPAKKAAAKKKAAPKKATTRKKAATKKAEAPPRAAEDEPMPDEPPADEDF
jgi:DNA topoisomerase-1